MELIETGRKYFSDFRDSYDSPLARQIIREFAKLDEEYEYSEATDDEDRADRARRGYVVRIRPCEGVEREIETPTHLLRLTDDGGKESYKAEVFLKQAQMLTLSEILALPQAEFVTLDLAPYAPMPAWTTLAEQVEAAYPGWAAFMLATPSKAGTDPTDSAPAPAPRVSLLMMRLFNFHHACLNREEIGAARRQVFKRLKYKQSLTSN